MNEAWKRKEMWRWSGDDFLVEVCHHEATVNEVPVRFEFEGPNRWNVYAYIYPRHPHFASFSGPDVWQEAATVMPLHGGPSYLVYPMYECKVTAVKVGCDYHHLSDNFTHFSTPKQAWEVFEDAERLHEWLTALAHLEPF